MMCNLSVWESRKDLKQQKISYKYATDAATMHVLLNHFESLNSTVRQER